MLKLPQRVSKPQNQTQDKKPQLSVTNLESQRNRSRFQSLQFQLGRKEETKSCVFCLKRQKEKTTSFSVLLSKALYSKYSSSQNYFFSKDINDILEGETTPITIKFIDMETILEHEEYLKRSYFKSELKSKIKSLLEYYKFHKDIPRLFMQPSFQAVNRFHDKRRRLEYARIKMNLDLPFDDEFTNHNIFDRQSSPKNKDMSVRQMRHLLLGINLDPEHKPQEQASLNLRELLITINNQKVPQPQSKISLSFIEKSMTQLYRPIEDLSQIVQKTELNNYEYPDILKQKSKTFLYQHIKQQPHLQIGTIQKEHSIPIKQISGIMTVKNSNKPNPTPQQNPILAYTASKTPNTQIKQQKSNVYQTTQLIGALTDRPSTSQQHQVVKNSLFKFNQLQSYSKNSQVQESLTSRQKQNKNIIDMFDKHNPFNPYPPQMKNPTQSSLYKSSQQYNNKQIEYPKQGEYHVLSQYNLLKSTQQSQSKTAHGKTLSQGSLQSTQSLKRSFPVSLIQKEQSKSILIVKPTVCRTQSQENLYRNYNQKSSSDLNRLFDSVKQPNRPVNKVYEPGVSLKKAPSNLTINQNNIVNIYLDERSSLKNVKLGSQTQRILTPQKQLARKIYDCVQNDNPFPQKHK